MPTKRYLVSGRVQGVGFRYYVLQTASRLGMRGEVRNMPDGRVECLAAGDSDQHRKLHEALKRGPAMSRVTEVLEGNAPEFSGGGFQITY